MWHRADVVSASSLVQRELQRTKRQLYTLAKLDVNHRRDAKRNFTMASTNASELAAAFATSAPVNVAAALALPHVVVWLPDGDLAASDVARAPLRVVASRRRLLDRLALVCRAANVIMRASRNLIVARWFEAVVPAAFAAQPEIKFLVISASARARIRFRFAHREPTTPFESNSKRTCERILLMHAVVNQLRVNRKTRRLEAPG